ncbi:hypothetical protein Tco_0848600 [Tanacetum coccineum]
MGTPTQVCVRPCPNISALAGRPFRCNVSIVLRDPESSTQADRAQSSRVPVPLPEDPYEAIRQVYLDGTDTESESFNDPIDTETPKLPPQCLHHYTLDIGGKRMSDVLVFLEDSKEDEEIEESLNFDSVGEDAEDEGPTTEDEDLAAGDEGLAAGVEGPDTDDESYGLDDESHGMDDEGCGLDDEGHSVGSDGLGLEEEEAVPEGQQQAAPVVGTVVSAPLGLGYGALRRQELALEEDQWTSGSLPISPSPSVVPSHVSSPLVPLTTPSPIASPATAKTKGFLTELGAQVQMQGGLISDHAVRLEELSPALFERYDRDIRELFARSGAVRRMHIEQLCGMPSVICRERTGDLRLQLVEERRARLELAEVLDSMRRGQEPREGILIYLSEERFKTPLSRIDLEKFKACNDVV